MSSQTTMTKTTTTKTVTVERRGCFDDDAFFQDSRSLFNNAISDVVNNWDNSTNTKKTTTTTNKSINNTSNTSNTNISNTNTSNTNTSNTNTTNNKDLQAYRQIRTQNLTKDDSQAICCVEEDNQYKMVVDVKDYKSDEINVLVTEEDVIVVEGTIERKVGNSTSSQSFRRQFNLPPCVDFTRVTSALSKDGVLKIIAPFKPSSMKPALKNSPARHNKKAVSSSSSEESSSPSPSPEKEQILPQQGHFTTHVETSAFDKMVSKARQDMEDLMAVHKPHPQILYGPPKGHPSASKNQKGAVVSKELIKSDNAETKLEERRWADNAPGVKREHHSVMEKTKVKGHDGKDIGYQERQKLETQESGGFEDILPDGTKRKTVTKSYQTNQVFSSVTHQPKGM